MISRLSRLATAMAMITVVLASTRCWLSNQHRSDFAIDPSKSNIAKYCLNPSAKHWNPKTIDMLPSSTSSWHGDTGIIDLGVRYSRLPWREQSCWWQLTTIIRICNKYHHHYPPVYKQVSSVKAIPSCTCWEAGQWMVTGHGQVV